MDTFDGSLALAYLDEAAEMNPGSWVAHSRNVGQAAALIAERSGLDPEAARAYGYVHDIGHRFGVTRMRHSLDGYRFLVSEGHGDAARYCITHSFPTFDVRDALGEWDCTDAERGEVESFLASTAPTDMDRLLQLCDAIALPTGFTLVERRLADTALRYGTNGSTARRWRAFLAIQARFERKMGCSVYSVLPGVAENVLVRTLEDSLGVALA